MKAIRTTHVVMLTAGLAFGALAVIVGQDQPQGSAPTPRLAVDRVAVDVKVIGDGGRPVTDLAAADFAVEVDGRSRRIVSAAYVPTTRGAVPTAPFQATYSSNASSDGRYLVIFEPESGDRDGKPHAIKVAVPARTSLDIRARSQFSIEAPTNETDEAILKETLQATTLATEIGLKLATYTLRDSASDKLRLLMAAEIDRSGGPDGRLALAYSLVDDKGRLIHSQIDPDVKAPVASDATQKYSGFILSDATGTHTLKIAVVDERGRRGSVEHTFRAGLTEVGEVRATDLLIADEKTGAGTAQPVVGREFTSGTVANYIELYSEAADVLKNTTVMFEVAKDEQARALDGAAGRVQPASADSPNRRTLEGSIPLALLPPGDYVARAVVSTDGRKVGQVTRPFRVGKTVSIAAKPKPGIGARTLATRPADIQLAARTERFEPASVLTPQVIGFFVERLNVGGRGEPNPEPVIDHARAGRFDEAVQSLSTPGTSVSAAFLTGLALYSKGELEPAAARFREALQLDSEFFPAAFYLGTYYAARGRDLDAVGAWRLALVTESDAPFIYTLLGDALLRLREVDQALAILDDASARWPENDEVQVRIGAALAMAGKRADALRKLEAYLDKYPDNQERQFAALRLLYQARTDGRPIKSTNEDRALFTRWATAYATAKGPQLALVEQWQKTMLK